MARHKLGSNIDEIVEVRSRLLMQQWDTMPEVDTRLKELEELIDSPLGDELHRHVVVSSVATLQTYHRGTIVQIVDFGDEYRLRAANSVNDKVSLKDALTWIEGTTFTFGELVANSMSCNSVTDLISILGILLDCDIKKALSLAISPWDLRNKTPSPALIVSDVDVLLSDLNEAFKIRHILAHEVASTLTIDANKCMRLHSAVTQWTQGIDAVLWATLLKDTPLTTYDMNMEANTKIKKARDKLSKVMRMALTDARSENNASWLRKNHFAWKAATYGWIRNSFGALEGTMWSAVAGNDLGEEINARAARIAKWVSWSHPEESFADLGLDF